MLSEVGCFTRCDYLACEKIKNALNGKNFINAVKASVSNAINSVVAMISRPAFAVA
jgi:hypothetical protein